MKDYWEKFDKPIIGLAPMDGYSDSAFRRICKIVNPNIITYTEFTSVDGLFYNSEKIKQRLKFHKKEKPILVQIFGKNIKHFVYATKLCEDMGFDGIDLNMGCPAKKVVKSEHGVALRKKKDLAFALVEAVAKATNLPVSVKTRLGWDDSSDLIEFGLGVQNAGANMICVHGRTFKQPYKVRADFEPIYELKKILNIPVIGNGGILNIQDGIKKLENLDGFLIGQASFGNPWVFSEKNENMNFEEKVFLIKEHARFLIEHKGEDVGAREFRKHLLVYLKGFKGAREFRKKAVEVADLNSIYNVIDAVCLANKKY